MLIIQDTSVKFSCERISIEKIESPVEFIIRLSSDHNISLKFQDLPSKDNECISTCNFGRLSVFGTGRTQKKAKINSALKMLKTLVSEDHEKMPLSRSSLDKRELDAGVKLICENDNYQLKLRRLCESHTAHFPVYTILSSAPVYRTQCQALGYKAIGTHTNYSIAKRIAAYKVIQTIPNRERGLLETDSKHRRKCRLLLE